MTDRVFLDTNIVLYLKDAREPTKRHRASDWIRRLLASQSLIVSPQVLNEVFYVGMRKFRHISKPELRRLVAVFIPACSAPLDATVVTTALQLEEAHGFQWWDSVLIASALAANCTYLLSEDMQHERVIGGMTIIDPFLTEPADILSASH